MLYKKVSTMSFVITPTAKVSKFLTVFLKLHAARNFILERYPQVKGIIFN